MIQPSSMQKIVIGTRGSELALWQAYYTKDILMKHGYEVEFNIISTKGDRTQEWNLSFDKIEGKGFFTKEIEEALLANEADLAVHSCKDLPTEDTPGLQIAAYSYRATPYDVLIIRDSAFDGTSFIPVRQGATVGTSSARRKAQFLSLRPDAEVADLRGNVPTRIRKLREGQYDAIILAAAGLERLKIDTAGLVVFPLKAPVFIPAPAQGVLAYQIRKGDTALEEVCKLLHDANAFACVNLEREILHHFHGGCQIPLGVFAAQDDRGFHLWISKAKAWNAPVQRTYQLFNAVPDAKTCVEVFGRIQAGGVFISRELEEGDYFLSCLTGNGFAVTGRSFIDFSPLEFQYNVQADWLFFTSKNGVKYFFEKVALAADHCPQIAAINSGTAQAIKALGYEVQFVGDTDDTAAAVAAFRQIAGDAVIVAPQASDGRGVVQQIIPHAKALMVYSNTPATDIEKRSEEILVFTSPMNVQAYFSRHDLDSGQRVVAIGPSTEQALLESGVACSRSFDPMPWSLADAVMQLSSEKNTAQ